MSIMFIGWLFLIAGSLLYVYRYRGRTRYANFREYFRKGWPIFSPLNCLLYLTTRARGSGAIMDVERFRAMKAEGALRPPDDVAADILRLEAARARIRLAEDLPLLQRDPVAHLAGRALHARSTSSAWRRSTFRARLCGRHSINFMI